MTWRDDADRPVERPDPPDRPYYRAIGDFQGAEYRRNAFARATTAEADALADRLGLRAGERVLDVGCGDGRHLASISRRGVAGVGLDVSERVLAGGPARDLQGVRLVCGDARRLPLRDASVDAAWSVCQGGLGTDPVSDPTVVAEIARVLRPGGRAALTFFHALFAVRSLVPGDAFDPVRMLHHQVGEVRGPDGERRGFDLWTSAYTAREAAGLVTAAGLAVRELVGCEPGRFDARELRLDDPEILVIASRPR